MDGRQDLAAALAASRAARPPLPVAQAIEIRVACPAAEGRDGDMAAAKFLIDHPAAYKAALIQLSVVRGQVSDKASNDLKTGP
jgi:carboxyl-terminal processing protease